MTVVSQSTPTLPEVLRAVLESRLADVHTALPAKIVKYDATTRKADVQPLLKREYVDGDIMSMPVISNVPVMFPSGGGAFLSFPVKAGDGCLLIFSERSLDRWLSQNNVGEVETADVRMHDITDAVAIVGLAPFAASQSLGASAADTVLNLGTGGRVAIGTQAAELLAILSQVLQALITTTAGGFPLSSAATLTALKQQLDSIKGTI
jgi:hypothetical protein